MTTAGSSLTLEVLECTLQIAKLPADKPLPDWLEGGDWFSVTRTAAELSIVCDASLVPGEIEQNGPWRALMVPGTLDFGLTGVLHCIAGPLAAGGISIFAVSTYETDYVLVENNQLKPAIACLREAGIVVHEPHLKASSP